MRTGARTPGRSPMMAYVEDEYAGDHEGGAATPRSTSGGKSGFWSKKHAQKRPAPTVMPTPDDAAGTLPAHGTSRSAPPSTPKTAVGRAVANGASTVRSKAATASQLARIAMDDPFNLLKQSSVGQVAADVNSPAEAKRLARSIFTAFRGHHKRSYLVPSDFNAAFKTPEEARAAFSIFDRDANGDISASEIKTTIISTYKERRFLTRSMQDVHHAVNQVSALLLLARPLADTSVQLDRILLCIAAIILLFVGLAIFNIEVGSSLTTFYSLAIAGAFIFKGALPNLADALQLLLDHGLLRGSEALMSSAASSSPPRQRRAARRGRALTRTVNDLPPPPLSPYRDFQQRLRFDSLVGTFAPRCCEALAYTARSAASSLVSNPTTLMQSGAERPVST
jgi:hypothetical protein